MRTRASAALLALASALAVTGQAPAAQGWARTDLHPVTQPAPVAGLFVLAVAQAGALNVTALDGATGATVWTRAASTSAIAPGVPPELVVAGDKVIYLAAVGSADALVAAEARTGIPVWSTGPGTFTSTPYVCADDRSAVCLTGSLASDAREGALRFGVANGQRLPAPHVNGLSPRELGVGLYDPGGRDPEMLTATRGAKVAWSRPLKRIFPLPGATSDFGWVFARIERLGLFVGSIGVPPTSRHGRLIFDRSRASTAGFRIADGVVKWRAPGEFFCATLPCAGDSQAGYSSPEQAQDDTTVTLRAVERGTLSFSRSHLDAPPIVSRDARVLLEGFVPRSGRTLWRFDAGHNPGLMTQTLTPAQVDLNTVLLTTASGRLMSLDLATGARAPVPPAARGWCRKELTYRQSAGSLGTSHRYAGQLALVWCAARSQRRLAPPPTVPSFVGDIGARGAGLVVWSDTAGVIAEPTS